MKAETKQNKTKKNDKYHRLFNHILDRGATLFQATNITSLARKIRANFVVTKVMAHIVLFYEFITARRIKCAVFYYDL